MLSIIGVGQLGQGAPAETDGKPAMPGDDMTITVQITNIEGAIRLIEAEPGDALQIEPGDRILLPDVNAGDAGLALGEGDDVVLTLDQGSLTLDQFYHLLDAELDVALGFGDGAAVDSLGGLLSQVADVTADEAGAATSEGDILYLVGNQIENPTTLSSDDDAVASADESEAGWSGLVDEEDVVFVDAAGRSDATEDGPFHGGEAIKLADLLDFGDSGADIALDLILAGGGFDRQDEFDGYFAPVALGEGQFHWLPLSADGRFDWNLSIDDLAGETGPTAGDGGAAWMVGDPLAADLGDPIGAVENSDSFWLV